MNKIFYVLIGFAKFKCTKDNKLKGLEMQLLSKTILFINVFFFVYANSTAQSDWWVKRDKENKTDIKEFISNRYDQKNIEIKKNLVKSFRAVKQNELLNSQNNGVNKAVGINDISPAERAALIELYNSTDGDNWDDNSGWKDPPLDADGFAMPGTENTWFGINVAADQVVGIDLSSNNLTGNIPAEIGNLVFLESLSLQFNNLTGSIPSELGNLNSLEELILAYNTLTGSLPAGMFDPGDLSNLWGLDVSSNQITGNIPSQINNLINLEYLFLNDNFIDGSIPAGLGDFIFLEVLDLSFNELSGPIPLGMLDPGDLPIIYYMDLSRNQISGTIPTQIENLSSLGELYLSGNKITGEIPDEFMNLVHLIAVDLSWNALYTNNIVLKAFIDAASCVCGWEDTQTIAPVNIAAYEFNAYSIITWTPVDYTIDGGGYDIYFGSFSGGPYNYLGSVNDKNISEYSLSALGQDFSYYFVVRARTDPHANNDNIIQSENSAEILITNDNAIYPPEVVRNTGATINEGETFVFSDLVLRSDDADSDVFQLLYTIVRKPENGLLLVNNLEASAFTQNDIANGKVSYKHDGGNSQSDYFTFYVSDTDGQQTERKNFIFTINSINDPPVVDSLPKIIMNEDEPYVLDVKDWYEFITDQDDEYESLIFTISNNDNFIFVEKNSDTTFTIIPEENYNGASSLSVVIKDKSDSASTTVEIEIKPVNDLPVIKNLIPVFAFSNGKTSILNLKGIASDIETPDSLLIYSFVCEPDSLLMNYDLKTGKLTLNAKGKFTGEVDLIVRVEDEDGAQTEGKVIIKVLPSQLTEINENELPSDLALYQNFPNPFNPSTTISYSIPEQSYVSLVVYDLIGNKVAELVEQQKQAGKYEIKFDAGNLTSGIYFYTLRAGKFSQTKKLILLK